MRYLILAAFLTFALIAQVVAGEEQPDEVKKLLTKIEKLRSPLSLKDAFEHLGVDEKQLKLEYGETGMGAHDWVYTFSPDKEWFLNINWHRIAKTNSSLVTFIAVYRGRQCEQQHVKSLRPEPLRPIFRYAVP